MSVLSSLGKQVEKLFTWFGSPAGKAVVASGEAVVEDVFPAATGLINLANLVLNEALKFEALSVAAAQQTGSGPTKLAGVVAALTPEALTYAEKYGFPVPTAAKIQLAANGLVAFLNAFDGTDGAAPTATS